MKNFIILFAVVVFAFVSLFQNMKMKKYKNTSQVQAVELSTLKDSVISYKTKTGQLYSKITAVEVDKRNLKESLEIAGFDIKELKDQNVKWHKITAALKFELEATGSGETSAIDTFYITTDPITQKPDTTKFIHIEDWTTII